MLAYYRVLEMLPGSWKVLEKSWNFFVTERVGTLKCTAIVVELLLTACVACSILVTDAFSPHSLVIYL